jgi:hypothetical protein
LARLTWIEPESKSSGICTTLELFATISIHIKILDGKHKSGNLYFIDYLQALFDSYYPFVLMIY